MNHRGSVWAFDSWLLQLVSADTPELRSKYEEVNLSNRQIDDAQCNALFQTLQRNSYVKVLDLQGNNITSNSAIAIAECLRVNTTLKEVNLEINPSFGRIEAILEALDVNNTLTSFRVDQNTISNPVLAATLSFKLQLNTQPLPFKVMLAALERNDTVGASVLDLSRTQAAAADALSMQFLTESLLRNKYIKYVDCSNLGVGDKGAETMGSVLRRSKTIETVLLANNGIGVHGVRDLAEGLRDNSSITTLSLRGNKIGDDGVRVIVDALKINDSLLQCDLSENAVSQSSLDVLNKALLLNAQPLPLKKALHAAQSNDTSVTEINFADIPRMDQSAMFLSPALKANTVVRLLNLSNACIGDEGAIDIANMIKVNGTISILHLSNNKITSTGGQSLAMAMLNNTAVTDINVANNDIRNEGAVAFVRMLQVNPNVIALNVELNEVTEEILQQIEWLLFINLQPKGLKKILPAIQNNDARVTAVNFSTYDGQRFHGDGSLLVLCRYLLHNFTVTDISFQNNNVGDMGAVHLAEVLRENKTILKLNFATNGICDRGATALAESLRMNNTVRQVDLENNCIGEIGSLAFVETLRENHTLEVLNLKGNRVPAVYLNEIQIACAINVQPIGLKDIIPRLRAKDQTLREIDFSKQQGKMFDDTAVTILCHEMRDNTSVTILKLSNNIFEEEGAKALGQLLSTNSSVTTLELANNMISDTGLQSLSDALKVNKTLRVLNVENNHIGDRGCEALVDALKSNDTVTEVAIARGNDIAKSLLGELDDEIALNVQPADLKRMLPKLAGNDPSITCLDLSGQGYDDHTCRFLALALRRNTNVVAINLSGNYITSTGLMYLAEMLEDNNTVREIHVKGQQGQFGIDNQGVRALVQTLTNHNHTLCIFEMDSQEVTDDVLSELQYSILFNNQPLQLKVSIDRLARNDETLTSLDLSTSDGRHVVTDVSLRLLCTMLLNNVTVTNLNLANNPFSDIGFACLCDVIRSNNTINTLDIRNCPNLTKVSMDNLARSLKANHALANFFYDKRQFAGAASLEDIECAVRINSVPSFSTSVNKISAAGMKASRAAPQNQASSVNTHQSVILSIASSKQEETQIMSDALRVWK